MPKYMVWVGAQGSGYMTIEADSSQEAKQLAEEDVDRFCSQLEFALDYFVGEPELLAE